MIKVIHGDLYSKDFSQLDKLIKDFSSCIRYSFCHFQKDKLKFNDVRNLSKARYTSLNTRYISDAVMLASALYTRFKDNKVIFGGKKVFKERKNKSISKESYMEKRDKFIYSRGDKTKIGNPNLRICFENNTTRLRITMGNRQFISYKLFIPQKFTEELNKILQSKQSYNIRLIKANKKYKVVIDYETPVKNQIINFEHGAIGIDCNPDRIAVANVSSDGNLLNSFSIVNNRLYFGSTNKRLYDISCIVKEIIAYASKENKGIVFEDLQFKKKFEDQGRKFNRTKSNFVWKKLITLLERKCIENGITYKKVNPAFTSIIGKYKYKNLYTLSVHESAAFVIGRRGLGFNEKLSLYSYPRSVMKSEIVRTLEGKYDGQRVHNWVMWKTLKSNYKALHTAVQDRMSDLKEFDDSSCYVGENPASKILEPELVIRGVANNITIP